MCWLIHRENKQIQGRLEQLHEWLDHVMPLPPPEPPHVWNNSWPWEVEPIWYYKILEYTDEPVEVPLLAHLIGNGNNLSQVLWIHTIQQPLFSLCMMYSNPLQLQPSSKSQSICLTLGHIGSVLAIKLWCMLSNCHKLTISVFLGSGHWSFSLYHSST